MKKQLILLAGLHKTGTTSVQRACGEELQCLNELGYVYPGEFKWLTSGAGKQGAVNHSYLLRVMFKEDPPILLGNKVVDQLQRRKELQGRVRELFDAFIERQQVIRLLMVSEAVSTLSSGELSDLKNWFGLRGFDIRLLCCIRSPLSWLSSMIDQRVAGGHGPHLTIRASIEQFEEAAGIVRPRILNLKSVFADAEFYSFKSAIGHPRGPAGYFFDRAGIEVKDDIKAVRANAGRCGHSVRIWTLINEAIKSPHRQDRSYLEFIARVRPALNSVRGERFTLKRDELGGLLPLLNEENDWLRANFGEEFCDEKIELNNDLPSLDDQTRSQLQALAATIEPRVRQIIDRYLATYD